VADIENLGEQERQAWMGLYRLFRDVEAQARSHPEDSYWQGKKDGLRSARIFFAEALGLDDEATNLERLRESSPTARSTDLEALQALAMGLPQPVARRFEGHWWLDTMDGDGRTALYLEDGDGSLVLVSDDDRQYEQGRLL
jgi:hypothetical protein